jgi:hypothetical protein
MYNYLEFQFRNFYLTTVPGTTTTPHVGPGILGGGKNIRTEDRRRIRIRILKSKNAFFVLNKMLLSRASNLSNSILRLLVCGGGERIEFCHLFSLAH